VPNDFELEVLEYKVPRPRKRKRTELEGDVTQYEEEPVEAEAFMEERADTAKSPDVSPEEDTMVHVRHDAFGRKDGGSNGDRYQEEALNQVGNASRAVQEDFESDIRPRLLDQLAVPFPKTPRKKIRTEIPSSQSPVITPLSLYKRRSGASKGRSPLQERSDNALVQLGPVRRSLHKRRHSRLVVHDTYEPPSEDTENGSEAPLAVGAVADDDPGNDLTPYRRPMTSEDNSSGEPDWKIRSAKKVQLPSSQATTVDVTQTEHLDRSSPQVNRAYVPTSQAPTVDTTQSSPVLAGLRMRGFKLPLEPPAKNTRFRMSKSNQRGKASEGERNVVMVCSSPRSELHSEPLEDVWRDNFLTESQMLPDSLMDWEIPLPPGASQESICSVSRGGPEKGQAR